MDNVLIDTSEMDKFAKKLALLPKQALPNAVRNCLNSAAFNMKTKTLPESGEKNFENRTKNFFKANSTFNKATGFNMDTMHSIVGMSSDRLKDKSTNYAVKDLEQQEHGGNINKKSFIPMKQARTGKSNSRVVASKNRMNVINEKNITSLNRGSSKNRKQQFIRAVIYAKSHQDGLVLGHRTRSGGRTLFRVDEVSQNIKSKKLRLKLTPIYNVQKGRKISVTATHFVEEASNKTKKMIPLFFKEASEFQFKKHLKI